jgi:hypothetical protein
MRTLAEVWPDPAKVPQLVALLPSGHLRILLDQLKDPTLLEWYLRAAVDYGWRRNVLVLQIKSRLHEREGKALTNFQRALPPPDSDLAEQVLKDPYNFDFVRIRNFGFLANAGLLAGRSGNIADTPFEMNTPRNGNTVSEWLLLFGLIAIAVASTKLLGFSRRWSDALIYTVVVFTVVIQMLRPAWNRLILWRSLSLIFVLHVVGTLFVVEVMPRSWRGIPGLFMTLVGVTESLGVVAILWKKAGLRERDGDKLHE